MVKSYVASQGGGGQWREEQVTSDVTNTLGLQQLAAQKPLQL